MIGGEISLVMSREKKLKKMIVCLAEAYGEQITKNRLLIYYNVLSGYDLNEVEKSMSELLTSVEQKRFPLIAEITSRIPVVLPF